MKMIKEFIADIEKGEAAIIECPKCKKDTFIGIAQAYTSDDKPYPVGNCCCCDMNLKALDDEIQEYVLGQMGSILHETEL